MADKPKYTVVGEYVTVKTVTDRGPTVVGLYAGAPWPEDAPEDATQHHLESGLIAEVGKAPQADAGPAVASAPAAQVPDEPVGEPGGPKPARVSAQRAADQERVAARTEADQKATRGSGGGRA